MTNTTFFSSCRCRHLVCALPWYVEVTWSKQNVHVDQRLPQLIHEDLLRVGASRVLRQLDISGRFADVHREPNEHAACRWHEAEDRHVGAFNKGDEAFGALDIGRASFTDIEIGNEGIALVHSN